MQQKTGYYELNVVGSGLYDGHDPRPGDDEKLVSGKWFRPRFKGKYSSNVDDSTPMVVIKFRIPSRNKDRSRPIAEE